jgi:glycosyltransferase involved in cell wall biosynthesis
MKILYHHRIRSKDGQYVHLESLTRALSSLGHEVVIVGPSAVDSEEFGSDGGVVALLKRWMPRALYELLELGYSRAAYRRLKKAIEHHRPDCLYERYNLFQPSGVWARERFELPLLLEVNAPLLEERATHDGLALVRLARWSEQRAWRGADRVLPVTDVLAGHVERAGVPRSRIEVIPNGVNLGDYERVVGRDEAKRRLGLEKRLVLGFTGFVREWHRMDLAIDLVAEQRGERELHVLLVGDGPAREALEAHAAKLGVQQSCTITGIVKREEMTRYLAAFDIALQPSVVAYASPLKLFEYLAVGLPVVAPGTPNIREVLSDGTSGLLFDPDDPVSFKAAALRLCEDDGLRERLGRAGRQLIVDRGYTWESNARRVVRLFSELGVPG